MSTLIIAVDMGHFKAYRVTKNPLESPRVEMIQSYDSVETHGKLFEKLSDQAGRFRLDGARGGVSNAKGYGEPHNLELEVRKKIIKLLAKDINAIVNREKCDKWHLAAEKSINNQVVEHLNPAVREKLEKKITSDLTRVSRSEILGYFEK